MDRGAWHSTVHVEATFHTCMTFASLVAQMVKNPPTAQETWVQSLGWDDPLEEEMTTQSNILAWEIPRTEEPGGLEFTGSQRVR